MLLKHLYFSLPHYPLPGSFPATYKIFLIGSWKRSHDPSSRSLQEMGKYAVFQRPETSMSLCAASHCNCATG